MFAAIAMGASVLLSAGNSVTIPLRGVLEPRCSVISQSASNDGASVLFQRSCNADHVVVIELSQTGVRHTVEVSFNGRRQTLQSGGQLAFYSPPVFGSQDRIDISSSSTEPTFLYVSLLPG